MHIGQSILLKRKALGLTQEGLARAIGRSKSVVCRAEKGRFAPSKAVISALVKAFPDHFTPFDLLDPAPSGFESGPSWIGVDPVDPVDV